MNRKGIAVKIVIGGIIGIIIAIVVFMLIGGLNIPGKINNFIPGFKESSDLKGVDIIGYNVQENEIYYFTGVEWVKVKEGEGLRTVIGNLNQSDLEDEFFNYYYKFDDIRTKESARFNLSVIRMLSITTNSHTGQDYFIRKINNLGKWSGIMYLRNEIKNNVAINYNKVGEIIRTPVNEPFGNGYFYVNSVRINDLTGGFFDENTKSPLEELRFLLKQGTVFYEENEFGDIGNPSNYTIISSSGRDWVFYNGERLNIYLKGNVIYSGFKNDGSKFYEVLDDEYFVPTIDFSNNYLIDPSSKKGSKNWESEYKVILPKILEWVDQVLTKPFQINNKKYCIEKKEPYLVIRLNQETNGNECNV